MCFICIEDNNKTNDYVTHLGASEVLLFVQEENE